MLNLAAIEKRANALLANMNAKDQVHIIRRGDGFYFPQIDKEYQPSKTGALFHANDDMIRVVVGPIGSGKSVMSCMEILRLTLAMPKCKDGIRRAKWGVVRNTYPELLSTTLVTWKYWFEEFGMCPSINHSFPITYFTKFYDEQGLVELSVIFLALDKETSVKKLMSLEVTGGWINEVQYVPEAVLNTLKGRTGRYPPKNMLTGKYKRRLIGDTNPPDTDSWFYKRFEENKNVGESIFRQPPGLLKTDKGYIANPEAENLENLVDNYYLENSYGTPDSEIRVLLMGEYGSFVSGDPIFTSYHDDIHSVDYLDFTPGLPVYIGWDYGLTPAAIFAQLTPRGQLQIIKEFCSKDMFLERFIDDVINPFINVNLRDYTLNSVGDPAGNARKDTDGRTCEDILSEKGIPTSSALSNLLTPRLGAIDKLLVRMVDGLPGIVISRQGCPMVRKGFQEKYCWKVVGGQKAPDKNEFSHPMDALQYIALEVVGIEKKPESDYKPRKSSGGLF